MSSAPVVVHRPSRTGGRRVTVHRHGRDEILGSAYSDYDLVVLLEAAGIADAEAVLDQPGGWSGVRDRTTTSVPAATLGCERDALAARLRTPTGGGFGVRRRARGEYEWARESGRIATNESWSLVDRRDSETESLRPLVNLRRFAQI